jgi:hypothetical protein
MSGGFFNNLQYHLDQIAGDIEDEIYYNNSVEVNEHNDRRGNGYSEETIQEMKLAVWYLKLAFVYAQRIDWLLSGDDGEETFHERLARDLVKNINLFNEMKHE